MCGKKIIEIREKFNTIGNCDEMYNNIYDNIKVRVVFVLIAV